MVAILSRPQCVNVNYQLLCVGWLGAKQIISHYLSQWWPSLLVQISLITWSRWVNSLRPRQNVFQFADDIFKHISLNGNFWIWNKISLKYVSLGGNWQFGSIGSDNGLVPNRHQAIIWNNDGMFYWCIYAPPCLNELTLQILDLCLLFTMLTDAQTCLSVWQIACTVPSV